MFLSRWKMMAGVLVVSLGGLAAMAGQCPKSEPVKSAPPPEMPVASVPASSPTVPPPAPSSLPPLPMAEPAKSPAVIPAGGTSLPPVPSPGPVTLPVMPVDTPPSSSVPPIPATVTPDAAPRTSPPASLDPPTVAIPPMPMRAVGAPPSNLPADPVIEPLGVPKGSPVVPVAAVATTQQKYRILLRVGEGEPVFEVRCGDDLMLKVLCEKVDVKSPEKGHGLSSVKASGKVRFSGFGAEGTCDELNFLAGSGEVGMTGHVKIQVKDKLGRVESELSADTMKYKIDPHTIAGNGTLKP